MTEYLEIEGFDELLAALRDVPEAITPIFKRRLTNSLLLIHSQMRKTPPAGPGNDPNRQRWYERNFGFRWRTADGQIKGERTSEQLTKRWNYRVGIYPQGIPQVGIAGPVVEGIEANNASYAQLVQSNEKQVSVHRRTGWVTIEDALEAAKPEIFKEFEAGVDEWINTQYGG